MFRCCAPNISQQKLSIENTVSGTATQLTYTKTSSYTQNVTNENNWRSDFVVEIGIDVPTHTIVRFVQRDHFNQQRQNNYTFHISTDLNGQGFIRSERYPDEGKNCKHDQGKNCKYAIDKFSQAYREVVSCLRHLATDNFLQPFLTLKHLISSNNCPERILGYKLYVSDNGHHQHFSAVQPIQMRFDFRPPVEATTILIGYSLLSTIKLYQ